MDKENILTKYTSTFKTTIYKMLGNVNKGRERSEFVLTMWCGRA